MRAQRTKWELVHATYSSKVGSIMAHGLRVSPRTKRGTAYAERGQFSEERDEAYRRSEEKLEEVRKDLRPDLPTRQGAIFFDTAEGSIWLDEPSIAYEAPKNLGAGQGRIPGRYDEQGRLIPDFGFGKDTLLIVDQPSIPCKCGVGDTAKSDEVFRAMLNEITGPPNPETLDPDECARKFWNQAEVYDPETFDPNKEQPDGERAFEFTEVWCPCVVPKEAILARYDKFNRPPGA